MSAAPAEDTKHAKIINMIEDLAAPGTIPGGSCLLAELKALLAHLAPNALSVAKAALE